MRDIDIIVLGKKMRKIHGNVPSNWGKRDAFLQNNKNNKEVKKKKVQLFSHS